jgi:hypothetical protein
MASFPQLFSGSAALYPVQRSTRRATRVLEFNDFSERRWKNGPTLEAFVLALNDVSLADMLSLRSFFDDRKGGFDATWDITLAGMTYSNMAFAIDTFEAQERAANLFSISLPIRQVKA